MMMIIIIITKKINIDKSTAKRNWNRKKITTVEEHYQQQYLSFIFVFFSFVVKNNC